MASDRQRRREGSQRSQAAQARRQQARQRRKNRNVLYGAAGLIAAAVAVVLIVVLQGGGPDLGFEVPQRAGIHSPPFIYQQDITVDGVAARIPPTSGNHEPQQSPYGFLGGPVVAENAVHNMEHGAVVIWYKPDDSELAGAINRLVADLGNECIVAGSYSDMSFPVAATVWGRVLPQDTLDVAELEEFVAAYRGSTGPEAGLCRNQS